MYFSLTSSSTSTQKIIWCWCMFFLVFFSIFHYFCPDTCLLTSVTRWTCHCYAIIHSLAQGVGQNRTRVFVVFHHHFHMGAVQRRCGIVEGLVQRYADSENWFVRWEEEERRCEDGFLVPVPFLQNWTDVVPLGRSGSNKRFPKLASTTTIFWVVQSVKRRTRWQEILKCLRAVVMI